MIYILFFTLIIIIVGYIFGISLINTIDKKLNNINIDIKYPHENFVNNNIETKQKNKNTNFDDEYDKQKNKNTNFDNEYYQQMNKNNKVEGFSNVPGSEFKEWNIEKKKTHVCYKNHDHIKNGRDINCTYGVTNYADPKDMSEMDYKIFNLNYPSNMTLQDYINWLYCYIDKESELPYNHLKNLEKLKAGKELMEEYGVLPPPSYYYPALKSEDYFDKMYSNTNEFQIAPPLNSQTGPMLGYNYNEYSEFSQNFDVYGSTGTITNKDISLKKNAKQLHDYIDPKDSNYLNEDNKNEIYRIKNVEI